MSATVVDRDERTLAVENASYRWGYLVLAFGLLGAVAYRSWLFQESAWDLLGLVVGGGLVITCYQWSHQTLSRRWVWVTGVAMLLAAVLAAVLAALLVTAKGP